MSVCYYFYAECRVNGKWVSINPVIKKPDGSLKVLEIIYGKSIIAPAYAVMCESVMELGLPEDASEEVKAHFKPLDKECPKEWGIATYRDYYRDNVTCFNYDEAIKNKIKPDRPYKYKGYVHKHDIAAFEVGERIDISHWLTPEEFEKHSEEIQGYYAWYEWNEKYDSYSVLYDIYRKVENLLEWHRESGYYEDGSYWCQDFIGSNVRIIVYEV